MVRTRAVHTGAGISSAIEPGSCEAGAGEAKRTEAIPLDAELVEDHESVAARARCQAA